MSRSLLHETTLSEVSLVALATHEARQRLLRYEREHQERRRQYEIEWDHSAALREDMARSGAVGVRFSVMPFRRVAA